MRTDGESKHRVARRRLVATATIAVLSSILMAGLATTGAAASPAEEEYTLDLPSATNAGAGDNGGVDGDAGGSDAPPDDSTEPAPAPPAPPPPETETDTSTNSSGGGGNNDEDKPTGQRSGNDEGTPVDMDSGGDATPAQPHTVPAIATDVAGDGGMPLLLAGLIAVAGLAIFLALWRRRAGSS